MPHLRERLLKSTILKDLRWSPIVSVVGMRQVGKSTLLRQIASTYLTLDDDQVLSQFEQRNWSELEKATSPLVIDEAQKAAGLFERVKLLVDRNKRPGQFILTGSVRFLSRKQIRESLTGRTSILELLPLTLAETHSRKIYDFISVLINCKSDQPKKSLEALSDQKKSTKKETLHYLQNGGMPGICFKRDEKIAIRMRNTHLETLLMRDLQLLVQTSVPFIKLKTILSVVAQNQDISATQISRQVQLSTPTVLQMLRAFEDLFILRTYGKSHRFTDVGVATFLGASRIENPLFHMERYIYQELYSQLAYLHLGEYQIEPYTTRGGVNISFCIRVKNSHWIAIAVDPSQGASEKSLKSLSWFAKKQKIPVVSVVLHQGESAYLSSTEALCIPYYWIS